MGVGWDERRAVRRGHYMRIIAGERRGHRIDGPKGDRTRPTSDLVRESIFNILGESVVDRTVIDLFAGTGALGLEALSRGAARAIFVEQNRDAVALIYRNLATLRYEDRVRVLLGDAYRWARSFAPIDDEPMVVLIDPPYREFEGRVKKIRQLVADLLGRLPVDSVIVLESGRTIDEVIDDRDSWDVRRYGGTQLAVREVVASDAAEHEAAPPGGGEDEATAEHDDSHDSPGGDGRPVA